MAPGVTVPAVVVAIAAAALAPVLMAMALVSATQGWGTASHSLALPTESDPVVAAKVEAVSWTRSNQNENLLKLKP